jgi:hypothetical protein
MGRILRGLLAQTPAAHGHAELNPLASLLSGLKFAGPRASVWQRGRSALVLHRRQGTQRQQRAASQGARLR